MQRRSFLGGLLAAPLAALVAKKGVAQPLTPPPPLPQPVEAERVGAYRLGARAFDTEGNCYEWGRSLYDAEAGGWVQGAQGWCVGVAKDAIRAGEAGWIQIYGMAQVATGAMWLNYGTVWKVEPMAAPPKRRKRKRASRRRVK